MAALREVVICQPLRTPVGAFGGGLASTTPVRLGALVVAEIIRRSRLQGAQLDGADVDEVVLGHAYPTADAPAIGRVVALDAGLPQTVTGSQVDRRCGSGLQAVLDAAMQIQTGVAELVIAGGTEVMSNAPFYTHAGRWGIKSGGLRLDDSLARGRVTAGGKLHPLAAGMIETAENLRREFSITRAEQDELAVRSQQRAATAIAGGLFDDELVPVPVNTHKGDQLVTTDEHPRPDTTAERLSRLRPVLITTDPEATVTAGNASGQNDAAAACIVTSPQRAEQLGLTPAIRLVSWGRAGLAPERMGMGPVPAIRLALQRAGLDLSAIDLIELNEAFAAQVLAVTRALGLGEDDWQRINVNGSGISLGHPVGATGARILATLAHEMGRRQARYGLETMCIGGGQGLAAIFELIP